MLDNFIYAQEGQSIWDIAVQEYGDATGVAQLILDNPDTCSFDLDPVPGTKIYIDKTKIINKDVVALLVIEKIVPANAPEDNWILRTGRWNVNGVWDINADWKTV